MGFVSAGGVDVDNATIEKNISSELQVKDGGVVVAKIGDDAVETAKIKDANVTTSKIADDNITTSKILDHNITLAKLAHGTAKKLLGFDGSGFPAEVDTGEGWIYIEKLTYSGDTTKISGTLPAYEEYKLRVRLSNDSSSGTVAMRLNGLSTSIYSYMTVLVASTTYASLTTLFRLGDINLTTLGLSGEILMDGSSLSGYLEVTPNLASYQTKVVTGNINLGTGVQVTTIQIYSDTSDAMTGIVEIFGRNRN